MLTTVPYGAYFIFGAVNFTMGIFAYWIPETKGVSIQVYLLFHFSFSSSQYLGANRLRSRWRGWTKYLA